MRISAWSSDVCSSDLQYTLARGEANDFTRLISKQSKESLARVEGVPRRRQDSLPLAALVLRRLLKALEPKEVIFSANGLREGIAYAMLDERQRSEDPMLASRTEEHTSELQSLMRT